VSGEGQNRLQDYFSRVVRDAAIIGSLLAAAGCVLPDFQKVEGTQNPASKKDGGEDHGPSCSMDLKLEGGCRSCVAEHCCAEAEACQDGACGEDVGFPINPLMSVTPTFDAFASCVLEHCDTEDTCDVSWGCVGKYKWPPLKEAHSFSMRVFNYADTREVGIPNIEVKQCEASDPGCSEDGGLITTARTDSRGSVDFTAMKGFQGYFELEGGGPVPATVQWSQPVYNVVDMFTHQALGPSAVSNLAVASQVHDSPMEKFKPGTGFLIARIQNCLPLRYMETYREGATPIARARDVRFTFTPSTGASRIYYVNEQAMLDLTLDRTSIRAYAGAFEVLATNVTVTATHAETGKVLATGVLPIRDAKIGFMYLVPNTGL
jgi:hypothetical protein